MAEAKIVWADNGQNIYKISIPGFGDRIIAQCATLDPLKKEYVVPIVEISNLNPNSLKTWGNIRVLPNDELAATREGTEPSSEGASGGNILGMINKARTTEGLQRLKMNPKLTTAARLHAGFMAHNCYAGHDEAGGPYPSVFDRIEASGYIDGATDYEAGENVGWARTDKEVFDLWMESPGHRANILHAEYDEMGLSALKNQGCTSLSGAKGGTVDDTFTIYCNTFGVIREKEDDGERGEGEEDYVYKYSPNKIWLTSTDMIAKGYPYSLAYEYFFSSLRNERWQEECPLFTTGIVKEVLGRDKLKIDILNLAEIEVMTQYMTCDGFGFKPGDVVVIMFRNCAYEDVLNVGFWSNPRPCPLEFKLNWGEASTGVIIDKGNITPDDDPTITIYDSNQNEILYEKLEYDREKDSEFPWKLYLSMPIDYDGYWMNIGVGLGEAQTKTVEGRDHVLSGYKKLESEEWWKPESRFQINKFDIYIPKFTFKIAHLSTGWIMGEKAPYSQESVLHWHPQAFNGNNNEDFSEIYTGDIPQRIIEEGEIIHFARWPNSYYDEPGVSQMVFKLPCGESTVPGVGGEDEQAGAHDFIFKPPYEARDIREDTCFGDLVNYLSWMNPSYWRINLNGFLLSEGVKLEIYSDVDFGGVVQYSLTGPVWLSKSWWSFTWYSGGGSQTLYYKQYMDTIRRDYAGNLPQYFGDMIWDSSGFGFNYEHHKSMRIFEI